MVTSLNLFHLDIELESLFYRGFFILYIANMDIHYIELVGWVGFLFIISGYYLNAKKHPYCFYIWGVGNILFILYAALINSIPMFFMSIFTLGMNIYGWIQWNKN